MSSAENVVLKSLQELKKWDCNYRVGNVEAIVRSITQFGFNGALRVWMGRIVAGNHQFDALCTMKGNGAPPPCGITVVDDEWMVPCVIISHLNKTQAQAFAIADNRTSELAVNDPGRLSALLDELSEVPELFDATGYTHADLEQLLREVDEPQHAGVFEDPGPEDPFADDFGEVRVKPGEIWALDKHRLLCGSSLDLGDVERLMGGKKAALCATDPPYLVDYTGADRPNGNKDWSEFYKEKQYKDPVAFYKDLYTNVLKVSVKKAALYCWHASVRASKLEEAWESLGILYHQQIIWSKPVATQGFSMYPWQHEPCLMGWRKGNKPERLGAFTHDVTTVWNVDWEGKARICSPDHPTQKPVELFARPMRMHTHGGDICFEPFGGSGSQLIAGEQLARVVYLMEIEPRFCEVILRRWEKLVGKTAERAA